MFPIITKHGSIFLEISLEDEALDEEKDPNSGGLIGNISKLSINTIAFASNSFAYISTEKWEALKKYWKDDEEKALEKIKKFRDEKGSKVAFNAPHISSLRFADDEKTGSVTVSTPWERETKKEGVLFDITLGIEASNELEFKDFNIATIAIPEEVKKEPKKKEKKEEKPAKEESTEEPTEEAPSD